MSADPFLPTMWAYYAAEYTGLCIGFKTDGIFSDIQKVDYVDKQEEFSCDIDRAISTDLLKKSKYWEHEKEYRIIKYNNSFLEFEQNDIVCVLFGCKMDEFVRKSIEVCIPNNVPIFTIKPDPERFCLCAVQTNRLYTLDELQNAIGLD